VQSSAEDDREARTLLALAKFVAAAQVFARRHFTLKTTIALLTLVSLTIGVILAGGNLYAKLFPKKELQTTVVMIVDTSSAMMEPFDRGKTKFEAVRDEILEFARNRPDVGLALRFTGHVCSTEYAEPTIEFTDDSASEVEDAFASVTSAGSSDFAKAVTHSVNDFDHFDVAKSAQQQSIYAFLGSATDECALDPRDARDEILTALQDFDGKNGKADRVKVDFFGVGASKREKKIAARLVKALRAAQYQITLRTPKNISQLRKGVEAVSRRDTISPQD
jgi:hypothetical protein